MIDSLTTLTNMVYHNDNKDVDSDQYSEERDYEMKAHL